MYKTRLQFSTWSTVDAHRRPFLLCFSLHPYFIEEIQFYFQTPTQQAKAGRRAKVA